MRSALSRRTMELMLIFWFLLGPSSVRTEGLVTEEIMKIILESCYTAENPSNPTVIVGNFSEFIDKVSIVRIDNFQSVEYYEKYQASAFKVSSVVLMEDSQEKLTSDLELLKETQLWNHMVPFFMIGKNAKSCRNSRKILATMQRMEILNSVYICAKSINNTSALYTLNPITNYAPHPWRKIEGLDDLNVYRQNFDANISCKHLTYDKTKILNGYTITAVSPAAPINGWKVGRNYFKLKSLLRNPRSLQALITALNATGRFEFERGTLAMRNRCIEGTADIMLLPYTLDSFLGEPALFPHITSNMIAVVKLKAEVSTLEKICRLWSTPVLITAAVALAFLFLVLIIINRSFGLALLDITRLLIYTGIRVNTSSHSFRIYFTTMLIFMVISNGVFQGKIAAFLTTRERENAIKSINELTKLGYKMYARYGTSEFASRKYTKCQFTEASAHDCMQFVLNGTNNVCAIVKENYETSFIHLPLDYVKESLNAEFEQFKCRWNCTERNGIVMVTML